MAAPGVPSNFAVQTANQQILVSWGLSAGATSYIVQRSLDNVTFTTIATVSGSPLATQYLDTAVTLGTQYWYKVAAVGTGASYAQGSLNLSGLPIAGETFSVGNITFTAVASGATGAQFNIDATIAATVTNIAASVSASSPAQGIVAATAGTNQVLFIAVEPGTEGNGLQLSTALTNTTVTPFGGATTSGTSPYTNSASAIPTPTGEMSLSAIRLSAKQRADRVQSQFVTDPEWNGYINKAMFELYDLLVTVYEDYFIATPAQFVANGSTFLYPLPNGSNTFTNGLTQTPFIPQPFYKLVGVDLALNSSANAFVTVNKFNFADRNRFVYPNTASTIYGVFNCQYRVMGTNIEFIPTPSGNQAFRLWYIPRITELLMDTDTTTISISGWIEYVIVRAAKYALDKEESDSSVLTQELGALQKRIEESASNRDAGMPDKISDTRTGNWSSGWNGGNNGPIGGF